MWEKRNFIRYKITVRNYIDIMKWKIMKSVLEIETKKSFDSKVWNETVSQFSNLRFCKIAQTSLSHTRRAIITTTTTMISWERFSHSMHFVICIWWKIYEKDEKFTSEKSYDDDMMNFAKNELREVSRCFHCYLLNYDKV
jgi:hypothetical protein